MAVFIFHLNFKFAFAKFRIGASQSNSRPREETKYLEVEIKGMENNFEARLKSRKDELHSKKKTKKRKTKSGTDDLS